MSFNAPTPQSYYYSGQGRLMIGERDINGRGISFIEIGNATGVQIDVTNTKFEHKESLTGNRGRDLVIIKEIKASLKFTGESLSIDNLALGLYGTSIKTTSTPVVDEPHTLTALGGIVTLNRQAVSAVIVKIGSTVVPAGDYIADTDFGTIYCSPSSAVLLAGAILLVSYTGGIVNKLDAFTVPVPTNKFIRFEGLNTVNGDRLLLEAFKCQFEPLSQIQLITEDLANAAFTANILVDPIQPASGSQLFRETLIPAS